MLYLSNLEKNFFRIAGALKLHFFGFSVLTTDNIENSRIDLKGIILQVPLNQIKVTVIIILPFNLVHLCFFLFHIEIEGKCGWIIGLLDYWGGGGEGILAPLSNY